MRKSTIKIIVLPVIFIVAVILFSIMTNQTNEDLTTEMANATLPVVTLYENQTAVNELYGYTGEMDAAYMRDTITPVDESRLLPVTIQTYQTAVDKISYEIRSMDAKRLIANADVTSYKEKKGTIELSLTIQNLLEKDEEYLLVIELESGDQTIRYYTRIIEPQDCYVKECVEFVEQFHNTTFDPDTLDTLSTYLERTTGDNDTLQYVSLNNSLSQVGWGSFQGKQLTTPVPSVKEITPTYNVIVLNYVVTRVGENGESEYYNVEEYYRVRYSSSRMYLLNFERTMEEIFRAENGSITEDTINLGIRSGNVEYQTNEAGSVVAFVQEGELWSYNQAENTLAKVFSFRGYEGIDERENHGEHDIKIVSIDEAGSMEYIVYGYMNRGIHEGCVGIAVYHYDSLANSNEEQVFIPSDMSFEVMKSELGQLMYATDSGEFYIMVDGDVYGIDLNTLETRVIAEGLTDEAYAISESNRYLAWVDAEQVYAGTTLHIMDFVTEKVTDVTEGPAKYVRPLGFMEEDFIYGVANSADVLVDAAGRTTFPMYQVKIMDTASEEHDILKTYEKAGFYVQGITISEDTIYLNRIQNNGTAYVDANQDMIRNRESDKANTVSVMTAVSEEKETQVQIALADNGKKKSPKILTPKETILEEKREVSLKKENGTLRYYVYVKGTVTKTSDSVSEAVIAANEQMGVVIGDNQQYVWKRSRKASQTSLSDTTAGDEDAGRGSVVQCVNAMLGKEGFHISVGALVDQGQTPKEVLVNTLKDATVLDLTGCTVDEVLYYVSNGSPVFALTGTNDAVLIVGYDTGGVQLYDPVQGSISRKTVEEADEIFFQAGSVFFTYLK